MPILIRLQKSMLQGNTENINLYRYVKGFALI